MSLLKSIHQYDTRIFLWVADRRTRLRLVQSARWISKSADGAPYLILMIYLALHGSETNLDLLGALLLGFFMERPLYAALKNLFRRNRPSVALELPGYITPGDRFSFPSGHTSAAFLVTTLAGCFHPWLALPLLIWASLVGMARVILGVHFPSDIVIGALMGAGLAQSSMEILLK